MRDPKNGPLVYLIAGIVAVVGALYFMTLDTSILDWFILAMGIFAIFKGVQGYWQNRGVAGGQKKSDKGAPDGGGSDDAPDGRS